MAQIHIAITRRVKPGMERAFEIALREFARQSLGEPGTTGVHLIGPVAGSDGEYGILRSFENEEACRAFYESELFRQWEERAQEFVIGGWTRRTLHGLEAFFRQGGRPPPRWKMAIVTWLGVFPAVLLWSSILPHFLNGLHWVATTALVSMFVVVTLAWGVMPLLTRFLAGWLHKDFVSAQRSNQHGA
jgi:antibiotic biosynthesis monooxygenase (ABM) superfamily enzyme